MRNFVYFIFIYTEGRRNKRIYRTKDIWTGGNNQATRFSLIYNYVTVNLVESPESNVGHYEKENKKLANHVSMLNRDLSGVRQSHQFEIENKDKEIGRLKKRVSKEIFQLEKLAEEQCSRANSLSDNLNQARQDYLLLRNRVRSPIICE